MRPRLVAQTATRAIVLRTRGVQYGSVTRLALASPSDLAELIKPFVFLDIVDALPGTTPEYGVNLRSGIATVTTVLEGSVWYRESSGVQGTLDAGDLEWIQAGLGVWHAGGQSGNDRLRSIHMWLALPPELEIAEPASRYVHARDIAAGWPVRVLLGRHDGAASRIPQAAVNYLEVRLTAGERWCYYPPPGHDVAWMAVHTGSVRAGEMVDEGEVVVFSRSDAAICFYAESDAGFVLGSAAYHPHPLHLGSNSVHTSVQRLRAGEAEIARLMGSMR